MKPKHIPLLLLAGLLAACGSKDDDGERDDTTPKQSPATVSATGSEGETLEVKLCDDETVTAVDANMERTPENGQKVADALMAQWKRKNPDAGWIEKELASHQVLPPHDNSGLVGKGQGATYGRISTQDVEVWRLETYKLAVRGSQIFHSADELGSDIAVSCDMCHPDAANTHPETYPKFQQQLGRVALLRDMINWCIEHPVRGDVLPPDSDEMRALEAYIIAQRTGKELQYGKH